MSLLKIPITVILLASSSDDKGKKKLQKGKRGGTFYISDTGKKVYIDSDNDSPPKHVSKQAKKISSVISKHYSCKDIMDRTEAFPKIKNAVKNSAKYSKIATRLLMTYKGYATALALDGIATAVNKGMEKSAKAVEKIGLKRISKSLNKASKTTNKISKFTRNNRKSFEKFIFGDQ